MLRWLVTVVLIPASVSIGAGCGEQGDAPEVVEPRTRGELVFRDPEECRECHPDHVADWEGSIHAYAMKDPAFHVMADIMAQAFGGQGGQFCTQCHSVPGFLGNETPVIVDEVGNAFQETENLSGVAGHGVSCDVCHSIKSILDPANARIEFEPNGVTRGPFHDPVPNDFHESAGSDLHRSGELCIGCHNVAVPFTPPLAIENTGLEWEDYIARGGQKQCQDCHMPERQGQAAVDGPIRTVHAHTFVGVDLALIADFPDKPRQRMLVQQMLESAANLGVTLTDDGAGTTNGATVSIENLSGHSLPSGVTSERRMWIEITVTDTGSQAVAYQSGMLDANGDIMDGYPAGADVSCNESAKDITPDPRDPDLRWFGALIRDFCGEITLFPFLADEPAEERLIAPLATAQNTYTFPSLTAGNYEVKVRLLFRAFQPHFLESLAVNQIAQLDLSKLDPVPIFTMAEATQTFTINP